MLIVILTQSRIHIISFEARNGWCTSLLEDFLLLVCDLFQFQKQSEHVLLVVLIILLQLCGSMPTLSIDYVGSAWPTRWFHIDAPPVLLDSLLDNVDAVKLLLLNIGGLAIFIISVWWLCGACEWTCGSLRLSSHGWLRSWRQLNCLFHLATHRLRLPLIHYLLI